MGRAVTLAELRLRAIRAADFQTLNAANQYAPLDELNFLINESVAELHDILLLRYDDYFIKQVNVTIAPNVISNPLPTDFYKVRGVYLINGPGGPGTTLSLPAFTERDRDALVGSGGWPAAYAIADGTLDILPATGLGTIQLRYIYQAPYLTLDTDALSIQIVPGWEAYIYTDVAVQLCTKAGRPEMAANVAARRDRIMARIVEAATRRDAGRPRQIQDVYGWSNTADSNDYGD